MTNSLLFLLQVSLVFTICYLLYLVFFRKLTFHTANRVLLISLLPISILIPLSANLFPDLTPKIVEIPLFVEANLTTLFDSKTPINESSTSNSSFDFLEICSLIYGFVVIIHLMRILVSIKHLISLRKNATIQKKNGYQLILSDVREIFTYFNWIFIPKNQLDRNDMQQILIHETAHIRLKHSFDVILSEIYIAFFWWNPLLYFYRKSLKSVHEFQADRSVITNQMSTTQYLQLLLKTINTEKPNNIYSYFNHPILKQRIDMITKTTSNKFTKLGYFLLIPICVFLISAFAKPISDEIPLNGNFNFYATTYLPPSLFPVQNGTKADITAYFGKKRNHPKISKGKIHSGIDIRAIIGTPVLAAADGLIIKAATKGDWGNLIIISHSDGYETWYAHLQGFNIKEKQEVKKGDIIGYVGNTGLSTGPHLHYEVKQHGKHLNPLNYLK